MNEETRRALRIKIISCVSLDAGTGCWDWQRARSRSGYGKLWWMGRAQQSHRLSYEAFGSSPGAMHVLHRCDNPCCVNPSHLFLGNDADNVADKVSKGRQASTPVRGSKNGRAKLDERRVATARRLLLDGHTRLDVAHALGVSYHTIARIDRRQGWGHVAAAPP